MLDIDRVKPRLKHWARGHYPYLSALVIFGSYAQGKATQSSDLDLAAIVRANPSHLPGERRSDEITSSAKWTQELKALLKCEDIHLEVLDSIEGRDESPHTRKYLMNTCLQCRGAPVAHIDDPIQHPEHILR